MPSLTRICHHCQKLMTLRTMVPMNDIDTIITYQCTHCINIKKIIINSEYIGNTDYINEYIPAAIIRH